MERLRPPAGRLDALPAVIARQQLPVSSPVDARMILAGSGAALGLSSDATARLRDALSRLHDSRFVTLTDSGTSALALAMQIAAGDGRMVALPAYACPNVAAAAILAGVRVLFYDVAPSTLTPDGASLRAAFARGARAAVIVHFYGYPVDVLALADIARETGAIIIEDAAQGAGASMRSRRVGSLGDLAVLSFGRGKGTTGGGGGALLVNNPALLAGAQGATRTLRGGGRGTMDVGRVAAQWALGRPDVYTIPASIPGLGLAESRYRTAAPPRSISAAAARMTLEGLSGERDELRRRREHASDLIALLHNVRRVVPVASNTQGEASYLRLALLARGVDASRGVRHGVQPGYPRPLSAEPALREALVERTGTFAGASELSRDLLTMPTHGMVTADDRRAVAGWLREVSGGTAGAETR